MVHRTLTGPGGMVLVLDSSEIFPDDPGNGTPALVTLDEASGSYACAVEQGVLMDGRGYEKALTEDQIAWLDRLAPVVDQFLFDHG